MCKKLFFLLILFTIIIGSFAPDESLAADSQENSSWSSATYVCKVGTNLMGVGMQWFLKSNYNWSSKTNKFLSEKIHPIVGTFVALIVLIIEFIINTLVFYVSSLVLILLGLIITIFGVVLIPIVFIFTILSNLFSPG